MRRLLAYLFGRCETCSKRLIKGGYFIDLSGPDEPPEWRHRRCPDGTGSAGRRGSITICGVEVPIEHWTTINKDT